MTGRRRRATPTLAELRRRLEQARLDTLALLRALDQARLAPRDLPQPALAHLATLDADCAEALWAFDQPVGRLDRHAMVSDTLVSLEALTAARAQVRARLPDTPRTRLEHLEALIRATLDPGEGLQRRAWPRSPKPLSTPVRQSGTTIDKAFGY